MSKPTVYDVAQAAGVSIATVSFVYSKPDRVKTTTRERVLAVADELGYVPSASARGLAEGRTRALGLYAFDYLLDDDAEPESTPTGRLFPLYADEVQRGIELECRALGYVLMVGSGGVRGRAGDVIDVAGRVDGLITFAKVAEPSGLAQIATRIPVVELGQAGGVSGRQTVLVDNRRTMAELVEHLLTVHGARTFVYLGAPSTEEMASRYEGFVDALARAGITAPAPVETSPALRELTRSAAEGVASRDIPDAVVCATDQEALVALDVLRERGIRVPDDVLVSGFDGILAARVSRPTLTTARQPMELIGRTAVRKLVAAIEGTSLELAAEPLAARIVLGGSCGCAG